MIRRREFIAGLGGVAAAWPLAAKAQPSRRICRIGYLHPGSRALNKVLLAFTERLRELGWVEGGNFVFEQRYANDQPDRLAVLAAARE